jgi:hypothetical protein
MARVSQSLLDSQAIHILLSVPRFSGAGYSRMLFALWYWIGDAWKDIFLRPCPKTSQYCHLYWPLSFRAHMSRRSPSTFFEASAHVCIGGVLDGTSITALAGSHVESSGGITCAKVFSPSSSLHGLAERRMFHEATYSRLVNAAVLY